MERATQIGLVVVAGLLGLLIGLLVANNGGGDNATGLGDEAFSDRVREALVTNPDILSEAFYALETQSRNAEVAALQSAIDRNMSAILTAPAAVTGGNLSGDITVIEFFDYECPFCRRALPRMDALREADGNIRYVYYEMPILGESSLRASLAALAAERQGRYEDMQHALMAHEDRLDEETIFELAGDLGIDVDQLRTDMADPTIQDRLRGNMQLAQAIGVGSTPTFVVNGQVVIGWQEDLVVNLLSQARGD